MQGDTAKQIARWVALGALFLIPLTPLIVANSLFFPFITGKAFYFRILVEMLVVAWGALAFLDKAYRPRFSYVSAAVLAFLLWMFVADLFAINVAKAFWSNFERMEGWVLLVHIAGFFFAASAVLRVEKRWRQWFLVSLAVSVVITLYAFFQLVDPTDFPIHQGATRIDATLGNSAYLAIYFLFNTFIALWLALTEKQVWLKWALFALATVEGIFIFFTETRGTTWGLIGALGLAAFLTALTAGKRARRSAIAGLLILIVLAGGLLAARQSSFVQGNHVLARVSSVSLADLQTRFTIWHMAWEGFLARPVTGYGQEGFSYVFDRYYDPSLYTQEPWFDRAHNAFIDWLVAGGAPAFLLYLSLFGSALWLLWRSSELSRAERIALTGALVGYAIHNLFVFDNLYSYVYFFAILALIDSQVARPLKAFERWPELDASMGTTYVLPLATITAVLVVWFVNVQDIAVASELSSAITASSSTSAIAMFEDLVVHPGHEAQEIREQLVAFESGIVQDQNATNEEKQQVVTLTIGEMKKQVASHPLDTREQLQLAYAYRAAGDSPDALTQVLSAGALSPTMETIWTLAGATSWDLGDLSGAAGYFDKAYTLGPQFSDLASYAAAGAYGVGNTAKGDAILEKTYGTTDVDSQILAAGYYQGKDWSRLIRLWQLRAAAPDASIQTFFSLAAAYYASGDRASAIAVLRQTMSRFPQAQAAGQAAIAQIQAGK